MKTQDARSLPAKAQEALRLRVVHAVVEQGMRPAQALRVFRVSRTAVYEWVQAYRAGGAQALQTLLFAKTSAGFEINNIAAVISTSGLL